MIHAPRFISTLFATLTFLTVSTSASAQSRVLEYVQSIYDLGFRDVAVSQDGRHVYGLDANRIDVFTRDATTSAIEPIQTIRNGQTGVSGLTEGVAIAISPEDTHVYVASASYGNGSGDAVAVFGRDSTSGELEFVQSYAEGVDGVTGISDAESIAISPDGGHFYVAGRSDDAVALFERNTSSGLLTFIASYVNGANGISGLEDPYWIDISPDGSHVYAAALASDSIVVFERNTETGQLTFLKSYADGQDGVSALNGIWGLKVSPDGEHLYAVSLFDDSLVVFDRNPITGELTFIEAESDGQNGVGSLDRPSSVSVSPDGSNVYVTSDVEHAVSVFDRDELTGSVSFVEAIIDGQNGVDGLFNAWTIAHSEDGRSVYIASWQGNAIVSLARDVNTGRLTFVNANGEGADDLTRADGLDDPISATVSPDGRHVYVASQLDDSIAIFERNPKTGTLTFIEAVFDGRNGVDGLRGAFAVESSPDGTHIYAVGIFDSSLAVFSRDPDTGKLAFVEAEFDGQGGVNGLEGAFWVEVSPDGGHVYVAGFVDNAVAVFERDPASGAVTFVEAQFDGVNGVDGLAEASSLAVSPDGAHVYATGNTDNAVVVFSRNAATGRLTFVEALFDDQNGVDGLAGAIWVIVSPDAANVYVVGQNDNSVVAFARDPASGRLTFVQALFDNQNGVNGLDTAVSLSVSPDGSHVYTAAINDDAIGVFTRQPSTGRLTFTQAQFDGIKGVDGLDGAIWIAPSPFGAHLYVPGVNDNSVSVFKVLRPAGLTGTLTNSSTGQPIACAAIELFSTDRMIRLAAVTDSVGRYFFEPLPIASYDLRAVAPGFASATSSNVLIEGRNPVRRDFALDPRSTAGFVTGQVRDDETNEPLVGTLIELFVASEFFADTYTCADGRFDLPLPTGKQGASIEIELRFSLQNYEPEVIMQEVQPEVGATVDENLKKAVIPTSSIVGQVLVSMPDNNTPLSGARVTVRGPANATVTTSDQGLYSFPSLIEGNYTVTASAESYISESVPRLLEAGIPVDATLVLESPENMEDTATDVDGDGSVDSIDIQLVINAVLGLPVNVPTADVSQDGPTDAVDIQTVINWVLGVA